MTSWHGLQTNGMYRNRSAAIRRLLRDAPSTTGEIAALLDLSHDAAQNAIGVLRAQKQVSGSNSYRKLYALTPRGQAAARKEML